MSSTFAQSPSIAPLIELRGITRQFGDQQVVRNLCLSVAAGETVALIGESGCGKSVTLRLMMALLEPTAGDVCWSGRPVADLNAGQRDRDRLRFGYLFQNSALFDSLDVFENVAFGLREISDLSETVVCNTVHERLEEVGLSAEICDRKPAELSGGMRKRVALARALALEPAIMLYDEPTTGLDPVMTGVINRLICQTRDQRPVTSVVVTHDLSTVQAVADRVVMLEPVSRLEADDRQVIFSGTFAEAVASPDPRVAAFVGNTATESRPATENSRSQGDPACQNHVGDGRSGFDSWQDRKWCTDNGQEA
ncbi:MAG: ABC transporter ATP-binding protein [Planctomycetaceae bacterium]|jgi:phospholipid/cholesterol/gamma-HCH transport system ATP-binding protein|nr:ABC transporter ATP-binding protein [Planctomycetaceae bacterium]MDP7277780.1 ATP-binding cassette domain-containing protein [Planctomycetaceae bacterium]